MLYIKQKLQFYVKNKYLIYFYKYYLKEFRKLFYQINLINLYKFFYCHLKLNTKTIIDLIIKKT